MPTSPATLTFSDDFNTLSLWNSATGTGTWATNFWYADPKGNGSTLAGNGEQQWYVNAEYAPTATVKPWAVDDGVLTITARPADASIQPLINGYQYTSGEINSFHTFTQQYGYFEMRADLPAGQGAWPAFWLLPANGSWPPELDIVETLGHDTTTLYTTVHSNATGSHTSKGQGTTVADTAVGFHTYAVDWKADTITWYYDGVEVFQVATPADMHQPMYMVANLAVGGYWPGNVDSTTPIPLEMKIDYIHVYSSKPDGIAPPPPAPVDPNASLILTANDKSAAALTGSANADILTAAHLANNLTGGGGADTFVFNVLPWNAGHITDFTVGVDKLDLSGLITASGYTGSDLVGDGYLSITADGHGGSRLLFDMDGRGAANPWATTIVTLDGVSPHGLTAGQLFGSSPTPTPSPAPSTPAPTTPPPTTDGGLHGSDTAPSWLTGGSGADILTAAHLADTLSGGAGADTFVFNVLPWNAGHVTDFALGHDKLDLSALFKASGYKGTDPVADGYLSFTSDGHGGARVMFDVDGHGAGNPWATTITTLDGVNPASLTASKVLGASTSSVAPTPSPGSSSPSTVAPQPSTEAGMYLSGTDNGASTLTGGAGADTLKGHYNADVLTGGGGADVFLFDVTPWRAGHVTDFTVGVDRLDLTGLRELTGYTGSDPIADGYLSFRDNGAGDTQVYVDLDGAAWGKPWPFLITTLDNVSAAAAQSADWLF